MAAGWPRRRTPWDRLAGRRADVRRRAVAVDGADRRGARASRRSRHVLRPRRRSLDAQVAQTRCGGSSTRGTRSANHTVTHPDLQTLGDDEIRDEMTRAASNPRGGARRAARATGARRSSAATSGCAPPWATWRATRCGTRRCRATGACRRRRLRAACSTTLEPGDIVVLHDGRPANEPAHLSWPTREATVEAVGLILAEMTARGLRSVTVSELLAARSR